MVWIQDEMRNAYLGEDYFTFLHSDAYVTSVDMHAELLRQASAGRYDYVSCYSHPAFYARQGHDFSRGLICPTKQTFHQAPPDNEAFYFSPPCPNLYPDPYWQGGYAIFRREAYLSIPAGGFDNGRLIIRSLAEAGRLLGAVAASYREGPYRMPVQNCRHVTQYGDWWFHVGDLTRIFYLLEGIPVGRFDPLSRYDQARLGLVYVFGRCGGIPGPWQRTFTHVVAEAGGSDVVLSVLADFARATPLEALLQGL
jgi:hypothetical protein